MKINVFFYLILMIFLAFCNNPKTIKDEKIISVKPYPHTIDINEGFKNSAEIKLSSIADSIKYIVLSKEQDVLIKNFPELQMTDNELYINSQGLIYRFDLSGKFLNIIGRNGRGPDEYLSGSSFSKSPSSNRVYIRRNYVRDYVSFYSSGEFIGKLSLLNADHIWEFVCLSDSIFMYTFQYFGRNMMGETTEDMILCGLFDKNGNKIQVIEHPANINSPAVIDFSRFVAMPPIYAFYDNEIVLNYLTDTIYKIGKNSISPGFIFNWSNIPHRQAFEEMYYIQSEPTNKIGRYGPFFETSGKAYFGLADLDKYYLFEYDKYTGLTKSMLTNEDSFSLVNDLDGGANYYPTWTNRAGDIWITYDDAIDFKKMHNEDFLSKSIALYPERKEKLKMFLKDLQIDDNPVLRIVYLKKYTDN